MLAASIGRREFLQASAVGIGSLPLVLGAEPEVKPATSEPVSFFFVSDTHFLALKDDPSRLDPVSAEYTGRLVDQLNKLPETEIPESAGGGRVLPPRGVIHGGDVIDSGDKGGGRFPEMQKTEWQGFEQQFGLTGRDGRLKFPVYEVHGNHDSPSGEGYAVQQIKVRNQKRPGLKNLSKNGLHYSWDWGDVHFVNLGIVVGPVPEVARTRRYAPHDSYPFLLDDLKTHVGDSGRPVVLTHHIDVLRYSDTCDPNAEFRSQEWDPCDVRAFHQALQPFRIAAVLYGHTHVRNVFRWNGTKSAKEPQGFPTFNTDNVSHFNSKTQAFLYFECTSRQVRVREFSTKDGWETGEWTPTSWMFPL